MLLIGRARWADEWFAQLKFVHEVLEEKRKQDDRRVRIGILDSGIDFQNENSEIKIGIENSAIVCSTPKRCQGFPETLDPKADKFGHGTHGISVLLKTAPHIAIYIARICDDEGIIPPDGGYESVANVRPG